MSSMSPVRRPVKSRSQCIAAVEQITYDTMPATTVNNPSLSALPKGPSPRIHSRLEQQAMAGGMPHDELHWRLIGPGARIVHRRREACTVYARWAV